MKRLDATEATLGALASQPELLRKLLRYEPETGVFSWRSRNSEMFQSEGAWKTWNVRFAGKPAFITDDGSGYLQSKIFGRNYRAHRVAWAIVHGEWPDEIDHINGDKSDNRISNLRSVAHCENSRNQKIHSPNTSGVAGVSWVARLGKWRSQIKKNGRGIHLGVFVKLSDAAAARKAAEIKYGFHKNHGRPL